MLERLLRELADQRTGNKFTFSLVIVDNDVNQTAKGVVAAAREEYSIDIVYDTEPKQNISLARNRAAMLSRGTFVAMIDDDEIPLSNWLLNMYEALGNNNADGVLGPVDPRFDENPPPWAVNGHLFERPHHETGTVLSWEQTRTGNVLLRRQLLVSEPEPFKKVLGSGGEDRDFFNRIIRKGARIVWCDEAPVYETIPPYRWKLKTLLKRALLRGKVSAEHMPLRSKDIIFSITAIFLYSFSLPFLYFTKKHMFIRYLIRGFDHIGKLLAAFRINPIKQVYITD